jgi:hypothetical protein
MVMRLFGFNLGICQQNFFFPNERYLVEVFVGYGTYEPQKSNPVQEEAHFMHTLYNGPSEKKFSL